MKKVSSSTVTSLIAVIVEYDYFVCFVEHTRHPKGVELTQMMSSNDFLFASIHEVVKTLIEAIIPVSYTHL